MRIRLLGAELFYRERLTHRQTDEETEKQTDMTKLKFSK